MAQTDLPGDDIDLLAAEYVLGVLDAEQLRVARRRLRTDRAFADEVAAWEGRFGAWFAAFAPVQAPADGWERVQRGLGWTAPAPRGVTSLARGGGLWRGLALAGFALASVCAVALLVTWRTPQVAPPAPPAVVESRMVEPDMVASISTDEGKTMWVASVHSVTGAMTLTPAGDMDVPSGHSPELWLIGGDGTPHSLGTFDPHHVGRMVLPDAMRAGLSADAVLAVTIEPAGGSPSGLPTGAVVAKGAMRAV